jgi:cysteinyl-tRNA synthetase
MGKSLGNFITLDEFFTGNHKLLEKAYSPMTIRFFMLQAHYRSTLDFSNEALQSAEKGMARLFAAMDKIEKIKTSNKSSFDIQALKQRCFDAINDDLNTPVLFAHLFDGVKYINSIAAGTESITANDLQELKKLYHDFVYEIAGLKNENISSSGKNKLDEVLTLLLNIRMEAKKNKDFATADKIRDQLKDMGIIVKDTKDGFEWEIE